MSKILFLLTLLITTVMGQRWRTRWPTYRPTTTVQAPSPARPTTVIVGNPNVQSLYGQCGGNNWSGPVACPTGAYCKNDGNPWYSQCVSTDQDDEDDGPRTVIITRTLTTVFSIPGPSPTLVSTYITFLTPKPTTTITLIPDDPWK